MIEKLEVTAERRHRGRLLRDRHGQRRPGLHAARLTVFRKSGERWLIVAHGNLGTPDL